MYSIMFSEIDTHVIKFGRIVDPLKLEEDVEYQLFVYYKTHICKLPDEQHESKIMEYLQKYRKTM